MLIPNNIPWGMDKHGFKLLLVTKAQRKQTTMPFELRKGIIV